MTTDGKTQTRVSKDRTPKDPAYRLRSWAWYWNLKQVSGGLSDYALDLKMLQNGDNNSMDMDPSARPRMFENIRKSGSDPNYKYAKRGFNLLERVESYYAETSLVYHSPLWRLIRPPIPTNYELKLILEEQMARLGLGRIDTYTYARIITEERPDPGAELLPLWPNPGFSEPLEFLAKKGSIEALSVLTALVLECGNQDLLELKLELIFHAQLCFSMYGKLEHVKPFRDMLWWVYNERILLNNWALLDEPSLDQRPTLTLPLDSILPIITSIEAERLRDLATHIDNSKEYPEDHAVIDRMTNKFEMPDRYGEINPPPWDPAGALQAYFKSKSGEN